MIVVSKETEATKWWIVYNEDKSIVNYGMTEPPQETETGLPLSQVFDDEQSWMDALQGEFGQSPADSI